MSDQGFFLALSGLGVSLAGFAGLIHALDRSSDADDPVSKWRIRNVVSDGFGIALAGILVWPVYTITNDEDLTVRIVSAFMLIYFLRQSIVELQPGPAWPSEKRRRIVLVVRVAILVLLGVGVVLASVGYLQLMFFIYVIGPTGTFIRAVGDLRHSKEPDESAAL